MRTIHHNGEFWYVNRASLLARAARWIVWPGGWLALGLVRRGRLVHPAPLSFFGHRLTLQRRWLTIRLPHTYLVIGWQRNRDREGDARWHAYLSRDATPSSAHVWLHGAPREVARAAEARAAETVHGLPLPVFRG